MSHIGESGFNSCSTPCEGRPWQTAAMRQALVLLPFMWETWIKFLVPSFSPLYPRLPQAFGGVNQQTEAHTVSAVPIVSLSPISNKQEKILKH